MHPAAPPHARKGEPLEGDGRGIKPQPLHRADLRHGQELLHARAAAPGQEYAESKEDQPEVPRHPQIRTLSGGLTQERSRRVISDRATLSLVAEDVVTQRVVSNRLRRGLTRREINEQYVRILDQAVEYNRSEERRVGEEGR